MVDRYIARRIYVFIDFGNFYWYFLQGFSRIATLLIAMLKINKSSTASAFRVDDNKVDGDGGVQAESCGSVCQQVHQTIQVTRKCSKTIRKRFDSSKRLFVG